MSISFLHNVCDYDAKIKETKTIQTKQRYTILFRAWLKAVVMQTFLVEIVTVEFGGRKMIPHYDATNAFQIYNSQARTHIWMHNLQQ